MADWLVRSIAQMLLVGLPAAIVLVWTFDLKREIRPVGGRDLNEIEDEERRRTTSLKKVTLILGAVLLFTFAVGQLRVISGLNAAEHRRIVITAFDNRTGDAELNDLGAAAAFRVAQRLRPMRELEVVSERASATAGIVVGGSYYIHADSVRFGIELTDANGQLLRYFAPAAVPRETAVHFVPRLSKEVSDTIARIFQTR